MQRLDLRKHLYGLWLAPSIGIAFNASPFDWRVLLVVLPTYVLVFLFNQTK